jgi:hypothetical protein
MGSPFLYFANDRLSRAELTAARLDGDVVELGEAFIPADAVETAALRAGSLAGILGGTLAATHLSAAWIHGVLLFPPRRHTVQRSTARRVHVAPDRNVVYRDLAVSAEDLDLLGGIRVTTPVRTLMDLARTGDEEHERAAREFGEACPEVSAQAIRRLKSGTLPHKRRALALLGAHQAGADQLDVTRYTS